MKFRIKRYFPLLGTLVPCFLLNCQAPSPSEKPHPEEPKAPQTLNQAGESSNPLGSFQQPAASPANRPIELPKGWSGTGVLSSSQGTLNKKAPKWGHPSRVEIVLEKGVYFLRATSGAKKISNSSLLEQTATNRARALLQATLKTNLLSDTQVVRRWKNPNQSEMIVQVQTPIPAEWTQVAPQADSVKDSPL